MPSSTAAIGSPSSTAVNGEPDRPDRLRSGSPELLLRDKDMVLSSTTKWESLYWDQKGRRIVAIVRILTSPECVRIRLNRWKTQAVPSGQRRKSVRDPRG